MKFEVTSHVRFPQKPTVSRQFVLPHKKERRFSLASYELNHCPSGVRCASVTAVI